MLLPTPPFKESVFTPDVRRYISRLVYDSTVSFYYPGAKEPFHIAPLQMESLGDALAIAVPELFPEKLEPPEMDKTKKKHKGALPS